jgi:replicative DNA helicase
MSETQLDNYTRDDDEDLFAKDTLHSERALIGAVIIDNSLMKHATEHIVPASFNITQHRPIFAAMVELHKREEAISIESIVNQLRSHNDLDAAGGKEYITSLDNNVPSKLTPEQPDYVDRFILSVIGKAISAAALSGHYSPKEVAGIFFEKTQNLRELRGGKESPLLKKLQQLLKEMEELVDRGNR